MRLFAFLVLSVFLGFLSGCGGGGGSSLPTFTVTEITTINGQTFSPRSLNNRGSAVGSIMVQQKGHAALVTNGVITDLDVQLGFGDSQANAVNDNGQVAGDFALVGRAGRGAFFYSGGQMTLLNPLGGQNGIQTITATDVNANGQVVGSSETSQTRIQHAYLWQNGQITDLGVLAGDNSSQANAINANGQVVGYSYTINPNNTGGQGISPNPFFWQNGSITPLPRPGPGEAVPSDINDTGQAVGYATVGSHFHALLWQNGGFTDLIGLTGNTSNSFANAINNRGEVVGYSYPDGFFNNIRAFLYRGGTLYDLNTLLPSGSGIVLQRAIAINDQGQIIASSDINSVHRVFLLTPQ